MTRPDDAADRPLDPEQARFMARVKLMMALSGAATLIGIAVVLGVVGYRVFRSEGSAAAPETTALLPKGARVTQTLAAGDRVVIVIETAGGGLELRSFDAQTLKPSGRLRFATEP